MKKQYIIILFILSILNISCQEVIDLDLNEAPKRIVIEASIDWYKGDLGNEQTIKISTTSGYYDTNTPSVSNASVKVIKNDTVEYVFLETENPGEYKCYNFEPEIEANYRLEVRIDDNLYIAEEKLIGVSEIEYVEQRKDFGLGSDTFEIKFFYQDVANQENYYMDCFTIPNFPIPNYGVSSDRFFDGNLSFGTLISSDVKSGDMLNIKLYGISKNYYNYMNVLLNSAGSTGPIQVPVGIARGNIINTSNINNYALGYFRLSEVDEINYLVE